VYGLDDHIGQSGVGVYGLADEEQPAAAAGVPMSTR
jgi:hypothetical protein